jgi:cytochrome b involved in lipid metabolism
MDFHPGGSSLLSRQAAGRDCTKEFLESHPSAIQVLENHRYLKIGRVVRTIESLEEVKKADSELVLFGNVYNITRGFYSPPV